MVNRRILTALFVTMLFVVALAIGAFADSQDFTTSDTPRDGGWNTSGYWLHKTGSEKASTPVSDDYRVGMAKLVTEFGPEFPTEYRNYFSFDLSSWALGDAEIISAQLIVPFGIEGLSSTVAGLTYSLWDVLAPVSDLHKTVIGYNTSIFDDLGGGTSYGNFVVPQDGQEGAFVLDLNQSALADIRGVLDNDSSKWFSVGGSLNAEASEENANFLFDFTGGKTDENRIFYERGEVVTLRIETQPASGPAAVPEPATILGFGVPMLMVGLGRLRALRK